MQPLQTTGIKYSETFEPKKQTSNATKAKDDISLSGSLGNQIRTDKASAHQRGSVRITERNTDSLSDVLRVDIKDLPTVSKGCRDQNEKRADSCKPITGRKRRLAPSESAGSDGEPALKRMPHGKDSLMSTLRSDVEKNTTRVLDLTSSRYRDLIISALKLKDVVEKDFGFEFAWDASRDTPEEMHYPNDEYKRFLSHSSLRSIMGKLSLYIFQREVEKDPSKRNAEGLNDARKLHQFPLTSSFSIEINLEAKRAKLNLLTNPVANQHCINEKATEEMPLARAVLSESPHSKVVIPAGMCQCVLTNLQRPNAPRFLSTAWLLDCTALVLYDRKNKIATLTHFWTQTISESNIKKQLELMIARGASSSSIEAKVVGGTRGNLWSNSGFFNCIEPTIASLKIPITETNVGQNRPQNILFDVETGNLYHLKSENFDRLDRTSIQNKATAIKLDWSSDRQYYFSDYDNTELLVSAEISFTGNT